MIPPTIRGPVIVSIAWASIGIPYIVKWFASLSLLGWIQLFLVVYGLFLTLCDGWILCRAQQRKVRAYLDQIVLDDVLRSIFDPQTGLIALVSVTVGGQALLYSLPTTKEQRAAVAQTTLEQDAKRVLLQPGGWKEILPQPLQWESMEPEEVSRGFNMETNIKVDNTKRPDDLSSATSSLSQISKEDEENYMNTEDEEENRNIPDELLPLDALSRIVLEIAQDRLWEPYRDRLQWLGMAAGIGGLLLLRQRRRGGRLLPALVAPAVLLLLRHRGRRLRNLIAMLVLYVVGQRRILR